MLPMTEDCVENPLTFREEVIPIEKVINCIIYVYVKYF